MSPRNSNDTIGNRNRDVTVKFTYVYLVKDEVLVKIMEVKEKKVKREFGDKLSVPALLHVHYSSHHNLK